MKRCPSCNRTYNDVTLNFCLEDGTPLVVDASTPSDPNATWRYPTPRDTGEPAPTEIYRQPKPLLNQVPEMAQPRPSPVAQYPAYQPLPRKKSNAIWWIFGVVAVLGVLGVGLLVVILALASLGSNANINVNNNSAVLVREGNENKAAKTNSNASETLPASMTDDFSTEKWKTGNYEYGDIWYVDGEYHMRSKEKTYLVMYAPDNQYNTENAKVRVTVRSVDGTSPASGYGLVVHGEKSKEDQLEDYGLLIYTGDEPQYQVVLHKAGSQKALVPWTKTSVIRPGTSPNQLEIRSQKDELSFYVNGRYLTRITDSENFKRGVAGFYTSETAEVAFDDLEIER